MDLTLSAPYRDLQADIRAFIKQYGHLSPKVGGGRKRPDQKTLDWQKRLVEHGYAGRTIPTEYGPSSAVHIAEDHSPLPRAVGVGRRGKWMAGAMGPWQAR